MAQADLLLSSYIAVEHLNPDANSNDTKEGYVQDASLQAVSVNIQPTSPYLTALYGGAFGKLWTLFTTSSGILETDRITTVSGSQTVKYIVKGKQYFNYGLGQHTELYVEEITS